MKISAAVVNRIRPEFAPKTQNNAGQVGRIRLRRQLQRESEPACDSLSELPHRCALAPENAEFPFEVRQLIYGRKPHFPRFSAARESYPTPRLAGSQQHEPPPSQVWLSRTGPGFGAATLHGPLF